MNRLSSKLFLFLLLTATMAAKRPEHPYRYSILDVPISLKKGTVTTADFSAQETRWYWILIQVEKPLPFSRMDCMMGTRDGYGLRDCLPTDPLLEADWKVSSNDQVVASGSTKPAGGAKWTKENIFKFLGSFPAEKAKSYSVRVTSLKNGEALNIAKPHLIVVAQGDE